MAILLLGGYGNVGSIIAASLIRQTAARVIIAGRRYAPAKELADRLGERAVARTVDVRTINEDDTALAGISLAIACFDLPDTAFARACLQRGIDYLDISADPAVLSRIQALDDVAQQGGGTALISVGLIPGLSNLMARRGVEQIAAVQRVDNVAMLGLGEAFGPASVAWTLSHMADRYDANTIHMDLGEGYGVRTAYRFAFADQDIIPRTLPVAEAASWCCFDLALFTNLIGIARAFRLGGLLRRPLVRRWIVAAMQRMRLGSDDFVLVSRTLGQEGQYWARLHGKGEAAITAGVAAEAARRLLAGTFAPGVAHMEQVFDLEMFFPLLREDGIEFEEERR